MDNELQVALRTGPFHVALRAAIRSRGLPLQRLQHRLDDAAAHVGLGTLSYWQSGRRRPERRQSLHAVAVLEEVLGLPPQSLLVLLGPPRPRGRALGLPRGSRSYADILRATAPTLELIEALGSHDGRLHLWSTHDSVTMNAGGGVSAVEVTQVVEAHQAADRHVAMFSTDPDGDTAAVRVTALDNCRVGRIRHDSSSRLFIAELLFDRTLPVGDTQILRYRFDDTGAGRSGEYHRGFRFPTRHVTIRVRFDPAALPVTCWRFARHDRESPDQTHDEVTLGPHCSAHVVANDVPPGVVGVGWDWG